jgi:ATP-dependent Zn protease
MKVFKLTHEDIYKDISKISKECLENQLYILKENNTSKEEIKKELLSNTRLNSVKIASYYYYISH